MLPSVDRPHFTSPGSPAYLWFVVYGPQPEAWSISRAKYACNGLPAGLEVRALGPEHDPAHLDAFRTGYVWDRLRAERPELASAIAAQSGGVVIRGELDDGPTLDGLRDAVGLVQFCLDQGAVGVTCPQTLAWWSPQTFREEIFCGNDVRVGRHVSILYSQEPDGLWIHTRGMRKFGRPDLSVVDVPEAARAPALDMVQRFITLQALGGHIPEGQAIQMAGIPEGWVCRHAGDVDDPDFNNMHVRIGAE